MLKVFSTQWLQWALIGIATAVSFFRLVPTLPTVMQDEYIYLSQALAGDLANIDFPNFLHSWMYSVVFLFGDNFYLATKVINFTLLFLLGLLTLLISRKVVGPIPSLLISLAVVAGPTSLYASVFMPEILFFVLATAAIYAAGFFDWRIVRVNFLGALTVGLVVGIASLAKPHGLFLIFGFALFLVLVSRHRSRFWINVPVEIGLSIAGFLISKLGIGFLLAGTSGLTILGTNYESSLRDFLERIFGIDESANASGIALNPVGIQPVSSLFGFVVFEIALLVLVSFMLSGLGLLFILKKPSSLTQFQLLVLSITTAMIVTVAAFDALVTLGGDDHSNRLLLRYFEYLMPLIFIAAAVELDKKDKISNRKLLLTVLVLIASTLTWLFWIPGIDRKLSDSSSLLGATTNGFTLVVYVVLSIVLLLLFVKRPQKAAVIATSSFLAVSLIIGFSSGQRQLNENTQLISADYAGQYIHKNFVDAEGREFLIVSTVKQLNEASAFWSRKLDVNFETSDVIFDIETVRDTGITYVVELIPGQVVGGLEIVSQQGFRILTLSGF